MYRSISIRLDLLALDSEPNPVRLVIEEERGTTCTDSRRTENVPDSSNPAEADDASITAEIECVNMRLLCMSIISPIVG